MTTAVRSSRFSKFPVMGNTSDRNPQATGTSFGSSWGQAGGGIWGNSSLLPRDAAPSNPGFEDAQPTGSGALTSTSEADPWGVRTNGWSVPETASGRVAPGNIPPAGARQDSALADLAKNTSFYPAAQSQMPSTIGPPRPGTILRPKTGSAVDAGPNLLGYAQLQTLRDAKDASGHFTQMRSENDQMVPSYRAEKRVGPDSTYLPVGHGRDANSSELDTSALNSVYGDMHRNHVANTIQSQINALGGVTAFPSQINKQAFHHNHHNHHNVVDDDLQEQMARNLSLHDSAALVNGLGVFTAYNGIPGQPFQFNPMTQPWESINGFATQSNGRDGSSDAFGTPFSKRGSLADLRNPPALSAYRGSQNAMRSYAGTPQPGSEAWSRPVSRDPRAAVDFDRRYQQYFSQQPTAAFFPHAGYYPHAYVRYPPPSFDPYASSYRPLVPMHGAYGPPIHGYLAAGASGIPSIPSRHGKDQDPAKGVRSALLEEFRSSSRSTKRFELKDIYQHIVEFSGDQHGSRFIQTKLETASSDEKDHVFREIESNAVQLMKDVFGNYVIQKFFEHGNQVQKKVLAAIMTGKVVDLSLQMYACRVVQKALEHVLVEQQAELIKELEPDILKVVKDQNGNHVVQKIIELVPRQYIGFIMDCFKGRVSELASHTYGCRVVQRVLEHGTEFDKATIMEELHSCAQLLITDQYGNYVVQHVIQHGKPEDRSRMIQIVTNQLVTLSKHKFASNVVEKCIEHGNEEQRRSIIAGLTVGATDGNSLLQLIMKDQYGNYVIQKLLSQLEGTDRDAFVEEMKPQFQALKKASSNGKQIAAIDRLMSAASTPAPGTKNGTPASTAPASPALPVELTSAAPTSNLTNESNSPSSSSPPNTGGSADDEVADSTGKGKATVVQPCLASPTVYVDEA